MRIPLFQVDAFTDHLFGGNPAAVCPLESWVAEAMLQKIAAENNLAETAFFVRKGDDFEIRWFTPLAEVPLCGHATLASAFVLFHHLEPKRSEVRFHSKSGVLTVTRKGDLLSMALPRRDPAPCVPPPTLAAALGREPLEVLSSTKYLAVYASADDVRAIAPNMEMLRALDLPGVIVTAPGAGCDFVSRFFAPKLGIDEDPVTGAAHCVLTPYWSARLGKRTLEARQLSHRGGELRCELRPDDVLISGHAVPYLQGAIEI